MANVLDVHLSRQRLAVRPLVYGTMRARRGETGDSDDGVAAVIQLAGPEAAAVGAVLGPLIDPLDGDV
jgi:hypothetical protein